MFLADAIEYQARMQPHAVALISGRRVVRYGELVTMTRRIAAMLGERGVGPGDFVGITMGNSPLHLVLLLALTRLGAVSVGVHPFLPGPAKQAVVDEFDIKVVISSQTETEAEGVAKIVADDGWLQSGAGRGDWRRGTGSGDLPWRIGLSSGTTGKPKGVLRTQAQTLNLALLQRTVIDIGPTTRFLVLMDLNLTANILRILRHLLAGSAIVFPRTTGVDDVLEAIDRHGVTHALASPDIVGRWIGTLPDRGLRTPALEHLAIAGGRMSETLTRAIVERLTPNLFIHYGTSETGPVAIADPATQQRFPGCVGRIVPWAQAQIVDEQDKPVPAGQPGVLRLRSITAVEGYYRNAEASARTFRNGWVYPGDTGRLLPEGILVIESRVDDIINVGGAKIDPAGIENALMRHPDVAEAAVFGAKAADGSDRLYAAVVLHRPVDERALIEHCIGAVGHPAPRRIIALRELPRNTMGKVLRQELVQRVRAEIRAAGAPAAGEA